MKKWVFILFVFLLQYPALKAQLQFADMGGAHFKGIGRAGVCVDGIGSIYYNQAGMGAIESWAVDASVERKFNLNDLNSVQVSAMKKFGFGTVGILFSQFGTSEYNEQLYGLAYGRSLSKYVSIGGLLAMAGYNSATFGSGYAPLIGLGSIIKISPQVVIGAHIFNPIQTQISENNHTTARYRMGLSYRPSAKIALSGEIDKDVYRSVWEYKMGMSYQVIPSLWVQAGFNPAADYFAFGIRYNVLQKLFFSGAGSIHQTLGFSPAASISYGN